MRRILFPSFVGLLLLIAGAARSLTLSDIRIQVRRQVRDTATDSTLQKYSDAYLLSFINEGQRDVVNQTGCLVGTTGYTLTTGTTFYSIPTDFIAAKIGQFKDSSGNTTMLEEKNEKSFLQGNPDWWKQTGKPINYYIRASTTSTTTTFELAIYPIPSTVASTGTLTLDYYRQVSDLSSDSEVPFEGIYLMYPYHSSLIDYTVYRIKLIEGLTTEAASYLQLYNNAIATINSKYGAKPNWSPSFSVETK